MAANSLGSFNFVRLSSPNNRRADGVETVYQHTELIQRPGVDGTGFMQVGLKGDPFQLASFVDVDTFANAQVLKMNYKSLVGYSPVILIVAGLNYYNPYGHKFEVIEVKAEAYATGAQVGGLTNGGLAAVEATWTLVAVYTGYP